MLDTFECQHEKTKVKGLCKCWIERHTCLNHFMNITYIFAMELITNEYAYSDMEPDWDAETKVRARGLLHSLKSSQSIVSFIVAKNVLEFLKSLTVKL